MPPGSAEPPEYPTLSAFYSARPERRRSPEIDRGLDWRDGEPSRARWRVSYLQATREIYAVRMTGGIPGPVRLLGAIPVGPGTVPRPDRYYRQALDQALEGWEDPAISGNDLAWVERQLAAARFAPAC